MTATSYCFGSNGSARFFRAVADSLDDSLAGFYADPNWVEDRAYFEETALLQQDRAIKALGIGEVVGVFSIFVAGYFGKKFLDEIYERTLKRPIGQFLDRLLSPSSLIAEKKVEIRDVVYLKDIDVVVVVRAAVERRDIPNIASLFLQAHRVANVYLESNGRCAPVHCHEISNGTVNIEPTLFLSVEHLNHSQKPT
jgi:hypothetical protein